MNPGLEILRAGDPQAALQRMQQGLHRGGPADTLWVGGGTDLVPLMRSGLLAPQRLVPVQPLGLDGVRLVQMPGEAPRLWLGAGLRMAAAAAHPLVQQHAPAVAQALRLSASAQVRNMATLGGNLLQHTRCPYWRQASARCNRLQPGAGCAARSGEQRHAAVLGLDSVDGADGADGGCIATHASDLAVALLALDADLVLQGPAGTAQQPIDQFYRLPATAADAPHSLPPEALLTAVVLPLSGANATASYAKVRDRASFQFALVSLALAIDLDQGRLQHVRLAAGGVAARPWRLHACEALLQGQAPTAATWPALARAVADAAVSAARPLPGNAFKLDLLKRLLVHHLAARLGLPSPVLPTNPGDAT